MLFTGLHLTVHVTQLKMLKINLSVFAFIHKQIIEIRKFSKNDYPNFLANVYKFTLYIITPPPCFLRRLN